jgi:hypothetical protein
MGSRRRLASLQSLTILSSRLYVNFYRMRMDSIRNHRQLIVTLRNRRRHVEVRVMGPLSCGNGHR